MSTTSRFLLDECDRLEAEVAKREAVISELLTPPSAERQSRPTRHAILDLIVRPRVTHAAVRAC